MGVSVYVPPPLIVTVTITCIVTDPPDPVQVRPYVVVALGLTVWLPLVAPPVLQDPVAVQLVAFVLVHMSVLDAPGAMLVGDAVSVAVGATVAEFTVTCASSCPVNAVSDAVSRTT